MGSTAVRRSSIVLFEEAFKIAELPFEPLLDWNVNEDLLSTLKEGPLSPRCGFDNLRLGPLPFKKEMVLDRDEPVKKPQPIANALQWTWDTQIDLDPAFDGLDNLGISPYTFEKKVQPFDTSSRRKIGTPVRQVPRAINTSGSLLLKRKSEDWNQDFEDRMDLENRKRAKWEDDELELLWEGIAKFGNSWTDIKSLFKSRSYCQIKDKGRRALFLLGWETGRSKLETDSSSIQAKKLAEKVLRKMRSANKSPALR